jgi:hypothetical protein
MDSLKLLLNASSQKSVEEIFVLAYKRRNENFTDKEKRALAELLSVTADEANKVLFRQKYLSISQIPPQFSKNVLNY